MNEIVMIALLSVAVYALQYLFKGPEDAKQQQGAPRRGAPPAPRTNTAKPRRQVSDLDRFLEETRKRKQQDESKPVVIVEPVGAEPSLSETTERERKGAAARGTRSPQGQRGPRGERKPQRPAAPPAPPPETPRRPLREQPTPVMLELAPPQTARSSQPTQAPAPPPAPTLPAPPPLPTLDRLGQPAAIAALAPSQRDTVSPVLADLMRLLRKPQGVALAILMNEILDRPAARRHG